MAKDQPAHSARRPFAPVGRGLAALLLLVLLAGAAVAQERSGTRRQNRRAAEASGTPLLIVMEPEIDLGEVPKGSSPEARFELRNAGDADLKILSVKTGCACTVAEYDKVVPPGEVGYLTATISTRTLFGELGQAVTLSTNDPDQHQTILIIRGTVMTAVRVLPEKEIVLRNLPAVEPVRRVIRRTASPGHGFFKIDGVKSSTPSLGARVRKATEPEPAVDDLPAVAPGDWVLEIRLEGQPFYGRKREVVEFTTGLDRQPVVQLDVFTEFAAPVALPVDRLFLQPRGGEAEEELVFTLREGLDPAELLVDAQPAGLTVELEPGGGAATTARVHWAGGRLEDGKLIFRIGDERLELLVLFVAGS